MEAFYSYYDMFASKGPEYLVVIAFLVAVFPFYRYLTGSAELRVKPATAHERIPAGVLFDATHTWSFLDTNGLVRVGIDDFLSKLAGPLKAVLHKPVGSTIKRGEPFMSLQSGSRKLVLPAPVSGQIQEIATGDQRVVIPDDGSSLEQEWLAMIKPSNWENDQSKLLPGYRLGAWMREEYTRFRDFLAFASQKYGPTAQPVILQDGGELAPEVMTELNNDIWKEFQSEFIDAVFEP